MSWVDRAACAGVVPSTPDETDIWFPDRYDFNSIRQAKTICAACPVREACLEHALSMEDAYTDGIFAGTTPDERVKIAQERNRARGPVCVIEGCGRPHKGRGMCGAHYTRWHKYGDPARGGEVGVRMVPADEVMAHVDALLRAGWTQAAIADEARVHISTVGRMRGPRRPQRVRRDVAERLLSLGLEPRGDRLSPEPLVEAIRARRVSVERLIVDEADRRMFYRSRNRGWIHRDKADRIAVRYLGLTLGEVYGQGRDGRRAAA